MLHTLARTGIAPSDERHLEMVGKAHELGDHAGADLARALAEPRP